MNLDPTPEYSNLTKNRLISHFLIRFQHNSLDLRVFKQVKTTSLGSSPSSFTYLTVKFVILSSLAQNVNDVGRKVTGQKNVHCQETSRRMNVTYVKKLATGLVIVLSTGYTELNESKRLHFLQH